MAPTTFYLVRHGEAQNNIRHIANSLPETEHFPLTAHGREQARHAARELSHAGASVIFTSPITRTRETAKIIAEATHLPMVVDERLAEVGMGAFNNHLLSEWKEEYPNPRLRLHSNNGDGVETSDQVRTRVIHLADDIRSRYPGKSVIIVSHADTLEQLHGYLLGESVEVSALGWSPDKGSVTRVVVRA